MGFTPSCSSKTGSALLHPALETELPYQQQCWGSLLLKLYKTHHWVQICIWTHNKEKPVLKGSLGQTTKLGFLLLLCVFCFLSLYACDILTKHSQEIQSLICLRNSFMKAQRSLQQRNELFQGTQKLDRIPTSSTVFEPFLYFHGDCSWRDILFL